MRFKNLVKGFLKLSYQPQLFFGYYDSPVNNALYEKERNLYRENGVKTILIEDFIKDVLKLECEYKPFLLYKYESFHNSLSAYELKVITILCSIIDGKNILEIGTFEGRATLNIAQNTKDDVSIFTMCLPQEDCDFIVGRYFMKEKIKDRIQLIFTDSTNYDFDKLPKMDLIFIDGDHSYEGVLSDSKNAVEILNEDGFIIWHDFNSCHLGSTKAILEICDNYGFDYWGISGTSFAVARKS